MAEKYKMKRTSVTGVRGVKLMFLFTVVIMGILVCRIGYLTLVKGDEYKQKAEAQQLSVSTLRASRGTIYDSNMNVLAQSASAWLCYINPGKINDENRETVVRGLVDILGADEEELRKDIEEKSAYGYMAIKKEVEFKEKSALSEYVRKNKITDVVFFDPDTKRYYPDGTLASTVLGFTGTDADGLNGLELFYDDRLTGTDGRLVTAKDAVQTEINNAYEVIYDPINGENLVLTLSNEIQTILRNALITAYEENGASNVYGIVMNTKTGAVLAQCNYPDYDSNSPYEIQNSKVLENIEKILKEPENTEEEKETDDEKEPSGETTTEKPKTEEERRQELIKSARISQWQNKAISQFYEPGSVFKVFLVAAALEEGVINDNTQYNCVGRITVGDRSVKDYNPIGHGVLTPRSLLIKSCNTFSVHVGQKLGIENFYKYYEAFGFTEKTGIDLPGEGRPVPGVHYHSPEISFSNSDLISSSFGQTVNVTPLQIAAAISAIGNDGKLMKPYIVKKTVDKAGNTIEETVPTEKRQVVSKSTADLVSSYMEDVCNSGTGKNAYVPGYHVAGKTGTSEKLGKKDKVYIGSFAGFAPCDDPEITVVIIIDEPTGANYSGGVIASPVAGEVFEKTLKYLGIEPEYSEKELATLSEPAPSMVGKTVEEAKNLIRQGNHSVKIVGSGDKVVKQIPEEGRTMPGNGVIVLYTEENAEKKTGVVPDFTGMTVAQANQLAVNSGFNIRISGSAFSDSEVFAYRQEYEKNSEAELGSIITVYFRSTSDIND